MHAIKSIRDDPAAFDAALKRRGLEPLAAHIISIDERRRAIIRVLEINQARRNAVSKEVGEVKRAKDDARAAVLMAEVTQLKESISTLTAEEKDASKELETTLAAIPNLPLDEVPEGVDEYGNVQHHLFGAARNYAFAPKPHDDLGGALGFMDFETAAKLSGARFVVLKKGLARLERAIGQFMLDLHTNEHGYTEVNPPLLVRTPAMYGTAQLPKFEDDQFATVDGRSFKQILASYEEGKEAKSGSSMVEYTSNVMSSWLEKSVYWLIPTAEVPLTNLVRESIVDEKELPMRLTALTPCFRAEAGAAGRDTRGMIRQHQFTKVELV